MSEYANYVEQAAYEDGLEKGRQESRKRISELESENEELKRLSPSAELLERISELEAKLDRVQCAANELAGALADD